MSEYIGVEILTLQARISLVNKIKLGTKWMV
jgi:hypothetical protein